MTILELDVEIHKKTVINKIKLNTVDGLIVRGCPIQEFTNRPTNKWCSIWNMKENVICNEILTHMNVSFLVESTKTGTHEI